MNYIMNYSSRRLLILKARIYFEESENIFKENDHVIQAGLHLMYYYLIMEYNNFINRFL